MGKGRSRPTPDIRSFNLPTAKRSVTNDNDGRTATLHRSTVAIRAELVVGTLFACADQQDRRFRYRLRTNMTTPTLKASTPNAVSATSE
jgi:hypothetical protein